MKNTMIRAMLGVTLFSGAVLSAKGEGNQNNDPAGVLKKPIPDKLIVLTFDDGPLSGYTVCAPILKSLGFGGSFYVCDFDSFKSRKDWYMTWRQMKAMDDLGLEIGNHSAGHFSGYGAMLNMEDQLLANHAPKPTTITWPLGGAAMTDVPAFVSNGYLFARGGYSRPYRPTVDNGFDIPSVGLYNMPDFVKMVRQATGGKIIVIMYHGVPDMEHPPCTVEPTVFKEQMQYLKDNKYKVIALRDLAEYVDPVKASKLPPTAKEFRDSGPVVLAEEVKPYTNSANEQIYTVIVKKVVASPDKDMLEFILPGAGSIPISSTRIGVSVPMNTDVTKLAPTLTISPLAQVAPASGTPRDFTNPQTYTVTAQDGSSQVYTVAVVKSNLPSTFTWGKDEAGNWSDASKWSDNLASGSAPIAGGRADYVLTFNQPGKNDVLHDLADGFLMNQLNLDKKDHGNFNLKGKSLTFAKNNVTGVLPGIIQRFISQKDGLEVPIKLASDIHVVSPERCFLGMRGAISGDARLIYDGHGTVFDGGADSNFSVLFIAPQGTNNTYSGGTTINGGRVWQYCKEQPLGTGPVTLNGGQLMCGKMSNPLIVNGGRIAGGGTEWNAPITLNGIAMLDGSASFNQTSGGISGPGGLTMIGTWSTWSIINKGVVSLYGANTYTGPTTILKGAIAVKKAVALYNADSTKWTPANISVSKTATLLLSAGGPGEFTGEQIGTLLKKLTTSINNNGMMAGSYISLDVTHTNAPVTVSGDIADSKGAGGGVLFIKKIGPGTLQLSGKNTYTGQTILESGTLSVASLNSVVKGKASSSLGAPTDIEAGEIVIGEEVKDGECALIYTGTGETTDRVMNLVGKNSTMTFDQAGSGLFKLTSDLWISGYGADKTIVLTGDTAGRGEFGGGIANPYDRAGKAITSLTKSGKGTWTLSGTNTYTGSTTVKQGTLSIANRASLGEKTLIDVSEGAILELNFKGEVRIAKLALAGKPQPPGTYDAKNAPQFIKGKGVLKIQ